MCHALITEIRTAQQHVHIYIYIYIYICVLNSGVYYARCVEKHLTEGMNDAFKIYSQYSESVYSLTTFAD